MNADNAAIVAEAIDDLAKARAEWAVANNQCPSGYIADETEIIRAYKELEKVLIHFIS